METLAQTWSEHCVHKTLKAKTEVYDESGQLLRTYGNLIKETIFDSTMELHVLTLALSPSLTRWANHSCKRAETYTEAGAV